jgi:zinc protease
MPRLALGLRQPMQLLCALLIPASASAQIPSVSSPDDPLPLAPGIVAGTLENGLRYFLRANGDPENRAELRLVVNAGSVLEDEDQLGLAHLVEHMAFNGTANFEKQELVEYLESVGMVFGPEVNASTSFDETVYMLQVPTDDPGIMATAFQILEDWAHLVRLDGEEIDKERGVVIEEWRLGRGAMARMMDHQLPVIFSGSRYAERLPIGKVEVLETFPHEAIRRFYHDWYRPDLMAVVAVGDFDAKAVEAAIQAQFSGIPPTKDPRARTIYEVPGHAETLFAIASDPEATSSQVALIYKRDLGEEGTLSAYRRFLVESLFTGMLNARLFELTQQAEPPFLGAGVGQGRFVRSSQYFQLGAAVADGKIPNGVTALLTEAERVARHGFTATELEREKTNLLRVVEQMYAERENQPSARLADELVRHFLYGESVPGLEAEFQITQTLLPTIGLGDMNQLAGEWLVDLNRVVMVNTPQKEDLPLPTEAQLASLFAEAEAAEIDPYEDTTPAEPLLPVAPTPSPVVSERFIPEIGVTEWTLDNDVRVILKPTDFKEDEVLVTGFSPGGNSLSSLDEHMSATIAAQVVAMGGVGTFGMVDLQRKLAGKAVSVSPSIGELTEDISGTASPKDLETLFQLIYLFFEAPRKDPTTFQTLTGQMEAFLPNRTADPAEVFGDTVQVTMTQGHPRARPLSLETFREVDLDEAFAFYQDRFADASDFTFVIVGSVDPDEIRPLVETYLGGLPDLDREESWVDLDIDPPTGVVEKEVRKGLEPQSQTRIIFTGPFEFSYDNRLGVRVMTSILETRLREVIREDMSGTYGVSVARSYDPIPEPRYSISISFGSDPQRVEELAGAVFDVIRELQENGPTPEDVQAVTEQERRTKETNLLENGWWISQLRYSYLYGQDPLLLLDESRMERVTPESVRRDANLWLRLDNYVRVTLLPEGSR